MKKIGNILLLAVIICFVVVFLLDRFYVSGYHSNFIKLEKERIVLSNKIATAKIVYENLNHVRDLVFKNIDFKDQTDTVSHESHIFSFITSCVNDLKLDLISVKPSRPVKKGLVTTYGYDIEIEGDFFKFGEFCSKLENSRRIISLKAFDVKLKQTSEKKDGGPKRKTVIVKMHIDTYRVKKAPELINIGKDL